MACRMCSNRFVDAAGARLDERQSIPPLRIRSVDRSRGRVRVARGADEPVRLADHAEAAPALRVARILREAVEGLTRGIATSGATAPRLSTRGNGRPRRADEKGTTRARRARAQRTRSPQEIAGESRNSWRLALGRLA